MDQNIKLKRVERGKTLACLSKCPYLSLKNVNTETALLAYVKNRINGSK